MLGHLYQIARVGLFVTDADLVPELSDKARFCKKPGPGLRVMRRFAGNGLFTAFSEEPNWSKAPHPIVGVQPARDA